MDVREGEQLIPRHWMAESSGPNPSTKRANLPGVAAGWFDYSYAQWTPGVKAGGQAVHMFKASDWGGQRIIELPQVDTVV